MYQTMLWWGLGEKIEAVCEDIKDIKICASPLPDPMQPSCFIGFEEVFSSVGARVCMNVHVRASERLYLLLRWAKL